MTNEREMTDEAIECLTNLLQMNADGEWLDGISRALDLGVLTVERVGSNLLVVDLSDGTTIRLDVQRYERGEV